MKMVSVRRRPLYKNTALFFLYGITFTLLRDALRSTTVREHFPDVPEVTFDYRTSPYNESKVALLIENRPSNQLAPLLLHFMSVVPPDWKFRFMGTYDSVGKVNNSAAIRQQVGIGKLDLTYIPSELSTSGQEQISGFLTNPWVVEHVLHPAEWLLLFQTDSIICANHAGSLDDWLAYAWVGAPWFKDSKFGGNGGFSMRRVSSVIEVLRHQHRESNSEPEDVWLTERIGHLPGVTTASGEESMKFSVEQLWYDEPLGYHIGGSGTYLFRTVWGDEYQRDHIFTYCPEMKMILDVDVEDLMDVCPDSFEPTPN